MMTINEIENILNINRLSKDDIINYKTKLVNKIFILCSLIPLLSGILLSFLISDSFIKGIYTSLVLCLITFLIIKLLQSVSLKLVLFLMKDKDNYILSLCPNENELNKIISKIKKA